jgi:hypothetical protein
MDLDNKKPNKTPWYQDFKPKYIVITITIVSLGLGLYFNIMNQVISLLVFFLLFLLISYLKKPTNPNKIIKNSNVLKVDLKKIPDNLKKVQNNSKTTPWHQNIKPWQLLLVGIISLSLGVYLKELMILGIVFILSFKYFITTTLTNQILQKKILYLSVCVLITRPFLYGFLKITNIHDFVMFFPFVCFLYSLTLFLIGYSFLSKKNFSAKVVLLVSLLNLGSFFFELIGVGMGGGSFFLTSLFFLSLYLNFELIFISAKSLKK